MLDGHVLDGQNATKNQFKGRVPIFVN